MIVYGGSFLSAFGGVGRDRDRLRPAPDGEGLLHLGRGLVGAVAGLVGVDRAGAGADEGDGRAAQGADAGAAGAAVKVTVRPDVAVADTV